MPFCQQVRIECPVVILHHLPDNRQIRALRLQDDQPPPSFPSRPSADLTHHHKRLLVSAEVGIVQHRVGIQDAHDRHLFEVQSFGNHLRTDQEVALSRGEIMDQTFVGIARPGGVEVHAGNARLGENVADFILYLFRTVTASADVSALAAGAYLRHTHRVATVVAGEVVHVLVVGKRNVAVGAFRHPAALPAFHHRGKAASVLEKDGLLAPSQRISYGGKQPWRERPCHHLPPVEVFDVHHLDCGKLQILVAACQLNKSVLALPGIVISFHRGGSRSQKCLRTGIHLRQDDGSRPCMIARRRILLLETLLMFLVDDDQTEPLEREEDGTSRTQYHIVRGL